MNESKDEIYEIEPLTVTTFDLQKLEILIKKKKKLRFIYFVPIVYQYESLDTLLPLIIETPRLLISYGGVPSYNLFQRSPLINYLTIPLFGKKLQQDETCMKKRFNYKLQLPENGINQKHFLENILQPIDDFFNGRGKKRIFPSLTNEKLECYTYVKCIKGMSYRHKFRDCFKLCFDRDEKSVNHETGEANYLTQFNLIFEKDEKIIKKVPLKHITSMKDIRKYISFMSTVQIVMTCKKIWISKNGRMIGDKEYYQYGLKWIALEVNIFLPHNPNYVLKQISKNICLTGIKI